MASAVLPHPPFKPEDEAKIQAMLQKVADARVAIGRAQRAGLDVSAHEKTLNDAETQLRSIHHVYFQNG